MQKPARFSAISAAIAALMFLGAAQAQAAVTITNQTALSITASSVQLRGDATESSGSTYSAYFEYGTTTGYGTISPTQSNVVAPHLTSRILTSTLSGLSCGTTYHFRMVVPTAVNGADTTFSTTPCTTTLSLARTAGSDPSLYGNSLTFTATLAGATNPTGNVNFKLNGVSIPSCAAQPMSGSLATCTLTNLVTGGVPANITATYFNDSLNYNASASAITQTVGASVPGSPLSVAATPGNGQATVTFSAPTSNGGTPITGYTVTSIPAGGIDSSAGSSLTQHVITGLTNGTPYKFTVTATNSAGVSAASAETALVTPLSTLSGGATIPGLSVTVPGIKAMPTIVDLNAGNGPAFANSMASFIGAALKNTGLVYQGQNALGTVTLSGFENGNMAFMPHSYAAGDTRANGIYAVGNGQYKVVKEGISLVIAPAVVNLNELTGLYPGTVANVADNGVISVTLGGLTYVVQPSIGVKMPFPASTTAKLLPGPDGQIQFVDKSNNQQFLYPAFLEPDTLRNALKNLDANSSMTIQFDGTAAAVVNGQKYTLIPDMTLGTVPSSQAGKLWWQDGPTSYHILNLQNPSTSQGLSVRQ